MAHVFQSLLIKLFLGLGVLLNEHFEVSLVAFPLLHGHVPLALQLFLSHLQHILHVIEFNLTSLQFQLQFLNLLSVVV